MFRSSHLSAPIDKHNSKPSELSHSVTYLRTASDRLEKNILCVVGDRLVVAFPYICVECEDERGNLMKDAIYLIKDESREKSVRLEPTPYGTEDEFQTLLERFPELLAGEQIDRVNPRRWLLVAREIGIADGENLSARWALDHFFVDQDGIPTLVEVKRQSDTRLRREVVGQVLEYAANAAKWWPGSYLQQEFEKTCQKEGKDPIEALSNFLAQENLDPLAFWKLVEGRLKIGDMRLIFFSDVIPPELQRIIEFLNSQTSKTEFLAIEVQRYSGAGFSTHIPRLLGQTTESQIAKESVRATSQRRRWDEASFFAEVGGLPVTAREAIRRVFALSTDPAFSIRFGTGSMNGGCNVYKPSVGPRAIISALSNGNLQLMFGSLIHTPQESEACNRLATFAETVLGVARGPEWRKQYPTVPPELWVSKVDDLVAMLKDLG